MRDFENISVANPFNPENQIWAVCYLRQEGDERNVLKLDNLNLTIRKRGRIRKFTISEIDHISLGHKRLLLPFIIGGILSPLALIAIYENAYPPFLLLSLFFVGLFLLYLGWTGSDVISIHVSTDKLDQVFVRNIPYHVSRFFDFFNTFISKSNEAQYFYHILKKPNRDEIPDTTIERENGYVLFTKDEFENYQTKDNSGFIALKVDPLRLSSPVNLVKHPDGGSFFMVKSINPESIIQG